MINIYSFPYNIEANPYLELFYDALRDYAFIQKSGLIVNDNWLIANSSKIDILHFHWPEDIWRTRGQSKIARLRGVIGFWKYLRLAHKLNINIWWTLHNIEHHEGVDFVDIMGYRVLSKQSNIIICHSNYAANLFKKRYKTKGKIIIMYHGLYEGVYPPPEPREKVLKELNLDPSVPTFSCLGNIRHYKGFDLAAKAIANIDTQVQLIIAGNVHKDYNIDLLKKIIAQSKNKIVLIPRFLTNQEFSNFINASDSIILPYRKITTSGLLLAALTFLKPVIVCNHPYFREIFGEFKEGVKFFDPNKSHSLISAILDFISANNKNKTEKHLKLLRNKYLWKNTIKSLVNEINGIEK